MKIVTMVARILLGLMFVVFGVNGFFPFIPMGEMPAPDSAAGHFFAAVSTTGYMKAVFLCQLTGGLLLLLNLRPVLGLTILCPVIFNIVLFHVTMDRSAMGIVMASVVSLLALFLIWAYWDHYRHLVRQPNK